MAISADQEANLAASRARTRQDKKTPFLINVDDARLIPNTPLNAKNPKYRVFLGDYRASEAERVAFLKSGGLGVGKRAVVLPAADEPFDIGKAQKDELIAFAFEQYQAVLDPSTNIRTLRKKVAELASGAGTDTESLG